jgi:hypothetical protein
LQQSAGKVLGLVFKSMQYGSVGDFKAGQNFFLSTVFLLSGDKAT